MKQHHPFLSVEYIPREIINSRSYWYTSLFQVF